jgi:hypothetical protein
MTDHYADAHAEREASLMSHECAMCPGKVREEFDPCCSEQCELEYREECHEAEVTAYYGGDASPDAYRRNL